MLTLRVTDFMCILHVLDCLVHCNINLVSQNHSYRIRMVIQVFQQRSTAQSQASDLNDCVTPAFLVQLDRPKQEREHVARSKDTVFEI